MGVPWYWKFVMDSQLSRLLSPSRDGFLGIIGLMSALGNAVNGSFKISLKIWR
jgi:hypothetical protein